MGVHVLGADVFVRESGSGPDVLFLHGNPDTGDVWSFVIDRLGDRYHSVVPDLPGFGRSHAPRDFDCSLAGSALFVDELVRSLRIPVPLHLVVHDVGGIFGLAWAVEHPDKVRSLTIMNTTFHRDFRWHAWARVWRTPLLGELSMLLMNRATFLAEMRRGGKNLPREHIDRTWSEVDWEMKRMVLRWYRATNPPNFEGWDTRMQELTAKVPTQVIWGERDVYIARSFAERFGGTVYRIPDAGHWVQVEAADRVAELLGAFLTRVAQSGPRE